MNPERYNPAVDEEFDDSPYADTNNQRKAYKKNLAEQRENLDQERVNAEGRTILKALNENPLAAVKKKILKDSEEAAQKRKDFEKEHDTFEKKQELYRRRKNRS